MFIHFVLLSLSGKAELSMASCLKICADLASFSCHLAPPPRPKACCGPLFWMGWPPLAGWLGPGTSACSGASGWRPGSAQHSSGQSAGSWPTFSALFPQQSHCNFKVKYSSVPYYNTHQSFQRWNWPPTRIHTLHYFHW